MAEQELKLHVPKEARAGVEKELLRGRVTRMRLQAFYFDTPDRHLIRAKIALRLRREGEQWVQTLKMPGENSLSRIEFNHERPTPDLDLSVYAETPVAAILEKHADALTICYETDVQRIFRQTRSAQGLVEIALDTGTLRAGSIELPISEIEFELKRGQLAAVFALGKKWQQTHGLILDVRSKSERGDRLASLSAELNAIDGHNSERNEAARQQVIAKFWSARTAEDIVLHPKIQAHAAIAAVSAECLDQIIRNAAILAEVDTAGVYQAGAAEHVHQLRVGIRRLRSAWSFFNGIAALPHEDLRAEIKLHFAKLGGTRDDDVLKETLLPVLSAAGQPALTLDNGAVEPETENVALSRAFQSWLLDMLAWVVLPAAPIPLTAALAPPSESEVQAVVVSDENPVTPLSTTRSLAIQARDALHASKARSTPEAPKAAVVVTSEPNAPTAASAERVLATMIKIQKPLVLKDALVKKLKKWHKRLLADGLQFDQLDIEARHELRKLGKKLRYALQFTESLLPSAKLKIYRKQLASVQNILGEMNDLAVARDRFIGLRDTQPSAWFACGWITSRLDALTHEACSAFKQLSRTETFWR
ncbi:MAG: CYTH and CHAD domain-containing protein [Candidatus Methylopumilus sp.]|nr:CYTH and CHAD domain-containing protein [Candidatus Methylopumilus sp.]